VSLLKSNKESVIEPRIVGTPGSILDPLTGKPYSYEDTQNKSIFFVSYGLEVNHIITGDEDAPPPVPTDMYYSRTTNKGEDYETVEKVNSNTGETEEVWDWLAKTPAEEAEAQLRTPPDGSRMYASYLAEDEILDVENIGHFEGSDVWLRKVVYEVPDSDDDGVPDANDQCPFDSAKVEPGECGCGMADVDSDDDGVLDCFDACSEDPLKTEPGICGCGLVDSEVDEDGDGTPDCVDECPLDEDKIETGVCGCGVNENDADGDEVPDCVDECSQDALKTEPGICGCAVGDVDSDDDGTMDCNDECMDDAL
jgi:hypothetical protein